MAAPSYATDLNDIYTDTGNFSTVGGGRVTDTETDDYIQGNNCWSHDPFSSGIEGGVHDTVTAETIAADDAVYIWTKCDVAATLASHAAGGIQALIGNATTALKCYYIRGSDDYQYGGWICVPVDPTLTPSTNIGTASGTWDHFGVRWNVPSTGAAKGYPMKIDAMRHGRQIEITAGDSGTPATWDALAAYDATGTRQWGICQPTNSGAAVQGLLYWGTATTAAYSRDTNRTIAIINTEWTVTDFTQLIFPHASNDVVWDNVGLLALGTSNRGIIDITANGAITWTNSVFQGIDVTNLGGTGSTFDGSKWIGCNEVDANGGSLVGAQILVPTVAADSYGLLWDVAANPDGSLDDMVFSKGANAHHAIAFGTSAPQAITLRGIAFGTGWGATDSTSATLLVPDTGSDKTWNISLVGCTGTVTVSQKRSTDTVNLIIDPVTTTVTVRDIGDNSLISGARVLLLASSAAGDLPYQESVTITSSGTTATVAHTGHGMATGDIAYIQGAAQDDYNGAYPITVTGVNAYTYTMLASTTSPATGTITSTGGVFNDLTTGTGVVTDSRSISADQPVTGRVRKSTTSPFYKTSPINETISSTAGLSLTVYMISDE